MFSRSISRKGSSVTTSFSNLFASIFTGNRAARPAAGAVGAEARGGDAARRDSLRRAVNPVVENLENRQFLAASPSHLVLEPTPTLTLSQAKPLQVPRSVRPSHLILDDTPRRRLSHSTTQEHPTVAATRPSNGQAGVSRGAFVAVDVNLPNGTGINSATVNTGTVRLFRVSDNAFIEGNVNTSGGGDAIVYTPIGDLAPNTQYRFEITAGLKDLADAPFTPFSMTFTTGNDSNPPPPYSFEKEVQESSQGHSYTAVTMGPDGKLYAGTLLGEIFRFRVAADGSLGDPEPIKTLQNAEGGLRLLTGLEFDPRSTAKNPILWVTHNAFAFENAPDFSGKISRLSGANLGQITDFVRGLPRAVLNHATNQMDFGPDGALYVHQGSNSAMGAPDSVWGNRPEHMLNAAVLRVDVDAIKNPLNVRTVDAGGTYNPFEDGVPVTLYATGIRNAYDLVWHSNGQLYVPTNGSAAGGNTPATPSNINCSNRIDFGSKGKYTGPQVPGITRVTQTQPDLLFAVKPGGYYGHPNPSRCEFVMNGGNPNPENDPLQVNQYPVGTEPDRNYRGAAFNFGTNQSPNGIIEYKSNALNGALKGKLLVIRYSGGDDILVLTPRANGTIDPVSVDNVAGFQNFHEPLDLVEDPRTGYIYVAEFGGQQLTAIRPIEAGSRISTDRKAMYFNDPQGGGTSLQRSLTITNRGKVTLTIPSGGFQLSGADAGLFAIANNPSDALMIAPGESFTLRLTFSAPNVSIRNANLRITSNDITNPTIDIPLRGLGTKGTGGLNEPSLQRILDLYQIPVNVGDSNPDETLLNNPPVSPNDEVLLPRMVKAGPGRVTLEPLSVFGVTSSPAVRFGWYKPGSPDAANQLLTVDSTLAQSVMPDVNGTLRFDPGTNPFGLYTIWPGFNNRGVYSEDALNLWEPDATQRHKVRFYPLKNADGSVVPNAFVVAFEEFLKTSTDFQDFVAIIRNVKPADPSPEIGIQNLDGVPFPDRIIFNRITTPDSKFPNKFHDVATVRVFNSGSENLNISDINVGGPWTIENAPNTPVAIAGGSSIDLRVRFTADTGDRHFGKLVIKSNDPDEPSTVVELAGFWQQRSEGGFGSEPDLLEMMQIFGYGTTIQFPGQKLSNGGRLERTGDEILSPYWRLADTSSPVTVRQLAAFHTQGATATTFWHSKGSNTTTQVLRHDGLYGQSFLPAKQGSTDPALGSFLPSGVFGFKIDTEWSDPTKNPIPAENPNDQGHHVRFWPARDRDGVVIPDTYIMAMDYSGINYDYNDNVFVVTNIRPEVDQLRIPTLGVGDANGGRISLAWNDPNTSETGYKIERAASENGPFTQIGLVNASVTVFNDNNVVANTTYYYRVRATNAQGDSPYSNTIAVAAIDGPRNPKAEQVTGGGIRFSWADLGFEVAYKIERAAAATGPWEQIGATGPNENSFVDTNVVPTLTYFYRVRATKPDGGDTGYSNVVSEVAPQIVPPIGGLSAPVGVDASAVSNDQINITWADVNDKETGYVIERTRNPDGEWSEAGAVGANATSFQDKGLAPNTEYFYRVRAANAQIPGPFSVVVSATTGNNANPGNGPKFTGREVGAAKRKGSTKVLRQGVDYDLKGGGKDIAGKSDQFHFASFKKNGNFDVKVRLASLSKTNPWTKAGIMLRHGAKPNVRNVFVFATPENGAHLSFRNATNGNTTVRAESDVPAKNAWLRLKRSGNNFTAFTSTDGKTWKNIGSVKFKIPAKLQLGLAVTSHNNKKLATARFRDFGNV